jgi:hypothetical protein
VVDADGPGGFLSPFDFIFGMMILHSLPTPIVHQGEQDYRVKSLLTPKIKGDLDL